VCADVGLHRRQVDLVRASTHQGPMRPLWGETQVGETCRRDEVGASLADVERDGRRRRYDDPGAGISHASPVEADRVLEDFRCRLEVVLLGVSEGRWTFI
jgi:hypothetical protein